MTTRTETNANNEAGAPAQPRTWFGALRDGKFWCDCEPRGRARCFRTNNGPNKGKLFWTCPKPRRDPQQCPFFVWVEQEKEAKEWLAKYGPREPPETPSKKNDPKSPETPWTKAKRKPVSREISDENENGGPSNRNVSDGEVFDAEDEGGESPSRKAAKIKKGSTPGGLSFNERLREAALPTPNSRDPEKAKPIEPVPMMQVDDPFPIPDRSKDAICPNRGGIGDLATSVLKLLHDDKVELKESTKLQIRHEIDLELDLHAAKARRSEATISKLSKRLDELESMVSHLTGGGSEIELSD